MSKLRGSQSIHMQAVADTLKLLLDFDDIEFIKNGIKGVINACEDTANKFKNKSIHKK